LDVIQYKEIEKLYPDGPEELHWIERYTHNILAFIRKSGGRRKTKKRRST
jgi:hypothetical protein